MILRRDIEQSADALLTALHGPSFRTWGGMDVSPITARGIRLPLRQENRTVHILSLRTHDGLTLWQGRFMRQVDARQFWGCIQRGEVPPDLWHVPFPAWPAGLNEVLDIPGLEFAFSAQSYITTTGAGTFNVPGTYNSANNLWEVIGAGGAGGNATGSGNRCAAGGGSGGYSAKTNQVLTPGGTTPVNVGAGGLAAATSASGHADTGNTGNPTFVGNVAQASSFVAANAGGGGAASTTATAAAGAAASTTGAIGTTTRAGAIGGAISGGATGLNGAGAAGASGPNGVGAQGVNNTGGGSQTAGGQGDAGLGGVGGTAGGGTPGDGTEFQDGVHGAGGGSGGTNNGTGSKRGGNYGAGSGGTTFTVGALAGGAGAQGIAVASWQVFLVVTNRRIYSYRR